ncbi:MAG: hypothetical protein H7252_04015 [Cytophaga sp.]|nr:hypothetical protein [Undibacterium sp.]
MFDYLSAPVLPSDAEHTVVFGRQDPLVAHALGDLIIPGLVETAVITGGIGKDSGNLVQQGFDSEAGYLLDQVAKDSLVRGYKIPTITLDEKATNGGENSRNSLNILETANRSTTALTAVAHATSMRRLAETLKHEASKRAGVEPVIYRKPTNHAFDPTNPIDREEAAAELLRIADWPAKGFLGIQHDLPEDLVDFARKRHISAPKPVASWKSTALTLLPNSMRKPAIYLAAKFGQK